MVTAVPSGMRRDRLVEAAVHRRERQAEQDDGTPLAAAPSDAPPAGWPQQHDGRDEQPEERRAGAAGAREQLRGAGGTDLQRGARPEHHEDGEPAAAVLGRHPGGARHPEACHAAAPGGSRGPPRASAAEAEPPAQDVDRALDRLPRGLGRAQPHVVGVVVDVAARPRTPASTSAA